MGGNDTYISATQGKPGQGSRKTSIANGQGPVSVDGYKQLCAGVRNKTAFTLFIPCNWFTEPTNKRHNNKLICLGMWNYDKYAHTTDVENCGDHAMTDNDNTKKPYWGRLYDDNDRDSAGWARPDANNIMYLITLLFNTTNPFPSDIDVTAAKPIAVTNISTYGLKAFRIAEMWLDDYIKPTVADGVPEDIDEEQLASIIKIPDHFKNLVQYSEYIKQVAGKMVAVIVRWLYIHLGVCDRPIT